MKFKKGEYQGHGFKKGNIPWNKGKKNAQKVTTKMLNSLKLGRVSGKKLSEETKKKISSSKKGSIPWNKGKKMSFETKKKISMFRQNGEWNGFLTPENRLERLKFKNEMQKQVLERDSYTCQMCGEKGGKLQVDHIQSWKEYVELRFSMDNCRTLCMACHYRITFGREIPEEVSTWGHNLSQIGGY